MVAKFAGKPLDMGIVQVYAPTSTAEEEEVEQFYEDLDKAMKCLKSQDIKIVMGDFNANFTSDGKCKTEIKKRIAIAKASFQKMSTIVKNRNISFSTKLKVLKTYVWSILLYGCETWTITAETKKNLEAAEMWFYRRMLRISWKEKRTNESILEETNQERSLIKTIRKRQLKFLGHICRHKGLEFLSLTGKIEGTRSRGRQRITFLDSLSSFVTGNNTLLRMTEDRDRWRIMIADVCSRQGI